MPHQGRTYENARDMRMRPSARFARDIDRQLAKPDHVDALAPMMFAWSRNIREAIGLPVAVLARRMNISQPAATKLEQNEAAGTISLGKLSELAEALECELIYGFLPKRPLVEVAASIEERENKARKAKRKLPPRT